MKVRRAKKKTETERAPKREKREPWNHATDQPANGKRVHEKSLEAQALESERKAKVYEMKTRGLPMSQIAAELNISKRHAWRLHARAFEETLGDHRLLRQRKQAEAIARLERTIRTYAARAYGGQVQRRNPDTKEIEIVNFEPDIKAAELLLRAERELSRILGHGREMKIEHTGAAGGPIMTANIGPLESARILRENFGGKVSPFSRDIDAVKKLLGEGEPDGGKDNTRH